MATQANPDVTIGSWTSSRLIRFIKQIFETDPPAFLPRASIQDLTVTGLLNVNDQIKFIRDPNYHNIGATGEPTFANSWANFGSPHFAVGYWKDPVGHVHLRGLMKSGVVGSTAFTLPVGFRPGASSNFGTVSNSAFGYVQVTSGGTVTPLSPSSNVSVSLDGLYFKAI